MDNLSELSALLTPLLSDPETMSSLRQAAEQIGLGGMLPEGADGQEEKEQHRSTPKDTHPSDAASMPSELLTAVTRLAPLLSAPQEDDATRLLAALRPFLSRSRARRLDEAERLLSLTRVLAILKESKLM